MADAHVPSKTGRRGTDGARAAEILIPLSHVHLTSHVAMTALSGTGAPCESRARHGR